jgi:rhodanese-related sulfurtransferase
MMEVNNISSDEFLEFIKTEDNFQIVDVRIQPEFDLEFRDIIKIPFDKLIPNIDKISRIKKVVIVCDTGANSFFAVSILKKMYNFTNLLNLKGGIDNLGNYNI